MKIISKLRLGEQKPDTLATAFADIKLRKWKFKSNYWSIPARFLNW